MSETAPSQPLAKPVDARTSNPVWSVHPVSGQASYEAVLPSVWSEHGAVGRQSQIFASLDEAERAVMLSREQAPSRMELMSLSLSFSPFYSIRSEGDGFSVTHPALRSASEPHMLVGTSSRTFANWNEARDFYLSVRNREDYPEDAIFALRVGDTTYRFSQLNQFGTNYRLADSPMDISPQARELTDFERRNVQVPKEATTYYRTLELEGWQSQVFHFVENFGQTPEGRQLLETLKISNLRLLTPNQAARLTLELVTRLKKYSQSEVDSIEGQSDADQHNALYLLYRGLNNRDNPDFDGNGVCRNFASTVKVVFDAIKARQTRYNYLQNTYCFYEQGFRDDYDPNFYKDPSSSTVNLNKIAEMRGGHAWNAFVTFSETGVTQTTADSTWSHFDYQTHESVDLDYTLQRMERDVYRILTHADNTFDPNESAKFYLFLVDSVPTQYKVAMDDEWKLRVRAMPVYGSLRSQLEQKYTGLTPEQYDDFALRVYANILEQDAASNITNKYLSRLAKGLAGKGSRLSPEIGSQIVKTIAERKQNIDYYDLRTLAEFPLEGLEQDIATIASKYAQSWQERMSIHVNPPLGDLIFANPILQKAIVNALSPKLQERLRAERPGLFQ